MRLEELAERIRLPKEAWESVRRERIDGKEYGILKDVFYQDTEQFVIQWKEMDGRFAWALEFFLKLAADTYEEYRKRGYADKKASRTNPRMRNPLFQAAKTSTEIGRASCRERV